ncbi:MAG: hypothetical protein ACKVPX_04080 [Myxococcaceae bacterium]
MAHLDLILDADSGRTKVLEPMRAYLAAQTTAPSLRAGDTSVRAASYVFTLRNGKWAFSRAYLEE